MKALPLIFYLVGPISRPWKTGAGWDGVVFRLIPERVGLLLPLDVGRWLAARPVQKITHTPHLATWVELLRCMYWTFARVSVFHFHKRSQIADLYTTHNTNDHGN